MLLEKAKRLVPVLLTAAALGCSPGPSRRIPEELVGSDLATLLDQRLKTEADRGFNGVVLVAIDGRPVLHQSYGFADEERSIPTSINTPFWIASVAKTFAAAAVMRLVENGKLSLTDSVGSFVSPTPPDKRGITIHQLLSHTSGLAERDAAEGIRDRDEAVSAILDGPPATTDREFRYTNDAYNLLAAIVEIVTQEPYEDFVRQVLLEPAGLGDTGFWGPAEHPEVAPVLAAPPLDSDLLRPNWGYRGATGMYSTAADLYAWSSALLEYRVLSTATVDRVFEQHAVARQTSVGYGWFTSPTQWGTFVRWSRGWESTGHGALVAVYPREELVMVIVSNTDERAIASPMQHELAAELAELLLGS